MAKTVNINNINPITFEFQDYSLQDSNLITNFEAETLFDPLNNYISYFIYDLNSNIIYSEESNFRGFSIVNNNLVLDPVVDLESVGFDNGEYNTVYLFLNNEVSSSIDQRLYIEQISSDRTEIRLNTTQIPNLDLIAGANNLINRVNSNPAVYFDFYLNFGDNQLVIANNILLDTTNPNDPTILIKLYESLPIEFGIKTECWVVTQVADPVAYNVVINQTFILEDENIYLKGPNVNLGIKDQINNSTEYVNYSVLTTSSYATGSGSLQYQINSILAERGIEINVDYSDYSNFIYFSSALTRLENFYYKLQLIEEYTYSASLSSGTGVNAYVTESRNVWQSKINEIITTFDGYDYFLYYESGSGAWPKTNSTYPYINTSTTSATGQAFLTTQSISASAYDAENNNGLINSIPSYLREDSANAQYELFIEMLGEMFDNIWIYYQDVTEKWNADNRLNYGVSKDLVADILRDLGLKIYQNSFSSTDLYVGLLGVTPGGNQFPFPFITGSLPTPSGYEYVNTLISASSEVVPLQDVEYSTYKRIYHNLPLLLKKKGTTVGLQDLITTFGVPDTILRVAEFGGKDRDNSNDWDYWQHKYNKAFDTSGSYYVSSSFQLNTAWGAPSNRPATVKFRFKTRGLPFNTASIASQSLWSTNQGVSTVLRYTGSGYISGSYSGSIIDPYYQYAKLDFYPNVATPNTSASVYLPFYDGGWWSVMITSGSGTFTLYAGDNLYSGDDGSTIGFIASSSIADASGQWPASTVSYLGSGSLGKLFSGSLQELRYYTTTLNSSSFEEFVVNSDSINNNGVNTTPNTLAFRASLGGELYTASVSIHPKVTGSWITTSSFASDSNFYVSASRYANNDEYIFLSQPAAGIQNIVSNKIQITDTIIARGNTVNTGSLGNNVLSQYRSIQQQSPLSASYTKNLAYTEVAFSPQNEINDDIMNSLGFFNMGEYIGDPRQRFSGAESYPDLDALRNAYFEKYKNNYDINDYIRLIKYFDNSLFKMIANFTPARSSLASGVVIKQNLLERNKYPQPEVITQTTISYAPSGSDPNIVFNTPIIFQDITITASIGSTRGLLDDQTIYTGSSDFESIPLETVSGSQGGAFATLETPISGSSLRPVTSSTGQKYIAEYGTPIEPGLILTQSFLGFNTTPSGSVAFTQSNAQEFFNGELSGSEYEVTNGELNEENVFKNPNTAVITYDFYQYTLNVDDFSTRTQQNAFLALTPGSGEIYVYNYYDGDNSSGILPSPTYGNKWILVSKEDNNNTVVTNTLQDLQTLTIIGAKVMNSQKFDILSISERAGYFIYLVAPNNINGVLANGVSGQQGESTGSRQIVLSPYDSYTFYNSAANPLFNNVQEARAAEYFYDLDYSTGTIVPTNYLSVISASQYGGFATPAQVQEYNWRLRRSIIPRYSGSKLFASNYNTWNLGDQSFGKDPVINYNGNVAFDITFVGGTYPEMILGTALNIIRANIFTSVSQSTIIDQNNPEVFNFMIDQYLGYSQSAQIFSNDLSPIKDNNIQTVDGTIGWPGNSVYFIPAQQKFGAGVPYNFSGSWVDSTKGGLVFYGSGFTPDANAPFILKQQVVDDNDQYATGSVFAPVVSASFEISKSLNEGNRWFVTLYTESNYPLQTFIEATQTDPLFPFNSGSNYDHSEEFSLASQGVYEINNINLFPSGSGGFGNGMLGGTTASVWQFKTGSGYEVPETRPLGIDGQGNVSTAKSLGALVWRANPFPQPVIFEYRSDYFPSGIGEQGGYVIPDDFSNNLKGSLFALQTKGVSPVVSSTNQVVNIIPSTTSTTNTGGGGRGRRSGTDPINEL